MAHIVSFRTSTFDVRAEEPNPINPIAGQSVLKWLRLELATAGYTATEPATEDWGWYIDVQAEGSSYLVGASADVEDATPDVDWTIQVHRHRSFKDRMLGRNKMAADDPVTALIERLVRADAQCSGVSVEREA
jgi:hypothetical protein